MTTPRAVWLNGSVTPLARARVPVFDRGLLFGDGVYETLRAYGGNPFRLHDHLERLALSARRLGFRLPGGRTDRAASLWLARGVAAVLAANRLTDARIRLVVTRGSGALDLVDAGGATHPTALIYAAPYVPPPPAAYRDGVRSVIVPVVRNDRRGLDPAIKSLNLLNNYLAGRAAVAAGAREAIMLNPQGFVAEAASANVVFVRRRVVCTPSLATGILAGITREIVLDLARALGLSVREGFFRPSHLLGADEAFVTASTIEILPLARIGARVLPKFRPVTRSLMAAYRLTVSHERAAGRPGRG
jgi:branched-chain amino acid aminotransferase